MASSIFFNGRLISVPGSYTQIDPSGLESIGLGATGIVALIGEASGGKPVSAMTTPEDFHRITRPGQEKTIFRSGDLLEAIPIAFAPGKDPVVLAGAQEVVAMKVNPATQSAGVLQNAQGDAIDLTTVDYGAHSEQVNVSVAAGTLQGKLLAITFEDIVETVDDLGGDDLINLTYADTGTDGWDTMTAELQAGGNMACDADRDSVGLDGDLGTPLVAPGVIEVVSNNNNDVNLVEVFGLDGAGDPIREALTLTGTVAVIGTQTFAAGDVLGVRITGTHAGTVVVQASPGGAAVFTITTGTDTDSGLIRGEAMFVSGSVVSLISSGASTKDAIVVGTAVGGALLMEKITLTGAVIVAGTSLFAKITAVILGDVEAAQTITVSAQAALSAIGTQDTLQKLTDFFNAKVEGSAGFTMALNTGTTTQSPATLDVSTVAVDCFSAANPGFAADLYAMVAWINANSQFLTAALAAGATGGAVTNTAAAVFMGGGIEGVTAQSDWEAAIDFLKQIRVNTIVPLTGDAAVHAYLEAHCTYMGGIGRNERDGLVGIETTGALPTKAEYKAAILVLNSRHLRACGQSLDRFNTLGVQTTFSSPFMAVVGAGMQAGSSPATSLTNKYLNALNVQQDSSWNPTDDAEELIQAGAFFAETVESAGRRWVRNVTTHLSTDNLAYIEASVNEAVNIAVYNFRTGLEIKVGAKGFAGTINAAKGLAIGLLDAQVDEEEGTLTEWRSLDVESILDTLEIGVEIAPVIPINFIKTTVHLVAIRQTAA